MATQHLPSALLESHTAVGIEFVSGLALCEAYFHECVKPLLEEHLPGLRYAAARIGKGSDVLGFDSPLSMDHDWGPQLHIFLSDEEGELKNEDLRSRIAQVLQRHLPAKFGGLYTRPHQHAIDTTADFLHEGTTPAITIFTLKSFLSSLNLNVPIDPLQWSIDNWLSCSSQTLLELTAGKVFHDDLADASNYSSLKAFRSQLSSFPHQVRLYLLASGWHLIANENHLMSRAGQAGDELGSSLIGANLCACIMRMAFLYDDQYAPYQKWFGSAFRALPSAAELMIPLTQLQTATDWQLRELNLCNACIALAKSHNRSGLTGPVPLPDQPQQFHTRPFRVFPAADYEEALLGRVIAQFPRPPVGSVDFWSHITDIREGARLPHQCPETRYILTSCDRDQLCE